MQRTFFVAYRFLCLPLQYELPFLIKETLLIIQLIHMKERIEDIWSEVVIGAIVILFVLIAIPVVIWQWLKGLSKKTKERERQEELALIHRLKRGDICESLWVITNHSFD